MLGEESRSPGPAFTGSSAPMARHGEQTSRKDGCPTSFPRDPRALPMHFFKP